MRDAPGSRSRSDFRPMADHSGATAPDFHRLPLPETMRNATIRRGSVVSIPEQGPGCRLRVGSLRRALFGLGLLPQPLHFVEARAFGCFAALGEAALDMGEAAFELQIRATQGGLGVDLEV